MSVSLTFTDLTPEQAIALLGGNQLSAGDPAQFRVPPPAQGQAPVPPPGMSPPQAPPAPPAPAAAVPAVTGKLGQVLATMDAYVKARGATGVADAKKVLAQVQLQRPQEANEVQLDWLLQAFANTSWVP